MLGRGRYARPVLDGPGLRESESREQVDEVRMVLHDLRAPEGLELLLPARHCLVYTTDEFFAIALEGRSRTRREPRQSLEDVGGHDRHEPRIARVVRVADRVDVAHRPVHPRGRDLEDWNALGDIHPAGSARDHLRIVGALGDDFRPHVQLEAVHHQHVGSPHLDHQARPDLEVVRILIAACESVDLHEVAADRFGQRLEVSRGGHDAQLFGRRHVLGAGRAPGGRCGQSEDQESSHGHRLFPHQNGCAGWAPRIKVAWRKYSLTFLALPPLSWKSR